MSKQVPWNTIIYDEFVKLGSLNEFEQRLLRDRMRGISRVEMSILYSVSVATVDRTVKRLKVKYDKVQPYSDKLPPRKFSALETYMDTH